MNHEQAIGTLTRVHHWSHVRASAALDIALLGNRYQHGAVTVTWDATHGFKIEVAT